MPLDEHSLRSIAVLGTGIMGSAFARRLLADGFDVRVYNRSPERTEPLRELGAAVCATPKDAVRGCSVVLASLFDDDASRDVLTGPDGAIEAFPAQAVLVETSTLSTKWIDELASRCRDRGIVFLDSPVCGSRGQADARAVTFLVSGSEEALHRAEPVLRRLGDRLIRAGSMNGDAAKLKFVNNLMNAAQMAALADAVHLAEGLGIELDILDRLLHSGASGSPLVLGKLRKAIDGDTKADSTVTTTIKDLGYIREAAVTAGVDVELIDAVASRYARAAGAGDGIDVSSALIASRAGAKASPGRVDVWGRLTRRRRMASLTFVDIVMQGRRVQVGYENEAGFPCRIGELWRFRGPFGVSKSGDPTLFATMAERLAPAAAPASWSRRTSDRYASAADRIAICSAWTRELERRGFTHVIPPMVTPVFDGGLARATDVGFGGSHTGYLRSNFEAPLQRHLADGATRVFHLGPVCRNGREYLLLEAYAALESWRAGLDLVHDVFRRVCSSLAERHKSNAFAAIAAGTWHFVDVLDALASELGAGPAELSADPTLLRLRASPDLRPEAALRRWMRSTAEDHGAPLIFHNTPAWFSPLYTRSDAEGLSEAIGVVPGVGTVFDAGLQERDPEIVAARIANQRGHYAESPLVDVLRLGVPPSFGFGSAVEKLVMQR